MGGEAEGREVEREGGGSGEADRDPSALTRGPTRNSKVKSDQLEGRDSLALKEKKGRRLV